MKLIDAEVCELKEEVVDLFSSVYTSGLYTNTFHYEMIEWAISGGLRTD